MTIEIYNDPNEVAGAAAKYFVRRSGRSVALSGGSTPRLLYERLAESFRDQIAWDRIHFYWSDERHVPPDHPESNYRMAYEALLSRVPVPSGNIHRIPAENPNAVEAAAQYETTLRETSGERLDLIFLGLGADGHTASIFPGSEVLEEKTQLVAAPWVEKFKSYRITMTLPLLNNGASIVFLVTGKEKAEIVKEVLHGPKRYPAQEIQPVSGELIWMLDRDAGRFLNHKDTKSQR